MLFIYLLEQNPQFGPRVRRIEQQMRARGDTLCTSVFTVGEVLTGYYGGAEEARAQSASEAIASAAEIIPIDGRTMESFARIRAALRVRTADALHLACAAEVNCDVFISNDRGLAGKIVPGIQFIVGLNTDIF